MPRITTKKSHTILRKEYRLRFLVVLGWMLSLCFFLTIVFLAPSYVLLNFYEKAFKSQEGGEEQSKIQTINTEYDQKLDRVYQLSQKIKTRPFLYVDVTRLITEYGSDFVVFDAIELAGSNQEVLITIRGQSDTRGNLLAFEKNSKR